MAIASADQIVHLVGSEIDDDHPHGDLDRIAYTPAKAGADKVVRGYPLVYVLESISYRRSISHWATGSTISQVTFSKGIFADTETQAANIMNGVSAFALSSSPGVITSSLANITKSGLTGFLADYPNVVDYSTLPCATATQPTRGDALSSAYLVALEDSLPLLDVCVYANGVTFDTGTVLQIDGGLDTSQETLPSWGYYAINWPKSLFYDERKGAAWTGPSPSAEIASFSLRGGSNSPVESVSVYLALTVKCDGKSDQYVRFPVAATKDGDRFVLRGSDLGVSFVQSVASHFGYSLAMPTEEYESLNFEISDNPGGACLVVKFKDL